MNVRQHIALTEAQIIAAEKGELQLETRDGIKVKQLVWFREPYDQRLSFVVVVLDENGRLHGCYKDGSYSGCLHEYDLFISEPAEIKSAEIKPAEKKPLYEVGEIIEVIDDDFTKWVDVEYRGSKNRQIAVWDGYRLDIYGEGNHRKKQKTVTLENKEMTVKEAIEYLNNL
jgi:hypothetical protein